MKNKIAFLLVGAMCTIAIGQDSNSIDDEPSGYAKILSQPLKLGPCHCPSSPTECDAWHKDSNTIKLDSSIAEWELEFWRNCCYGFEHSDSVYQEDLRKLEQWKRYSDSIYQNN